MTQWWMRWSRLAAIVAMAWWTLAAVAKVRAAVPANNLEKPVRVVGRRFYSGDRPYAFVGANFWQAAHLAADLVPGDRARLERELDELQRRGINNLRVMAGSEGPDGAPWRMQPALQAQPGHYNERLLVGLDYLLVALGERGMRAVLCLSNYWHWSGGLAQYLSWAEGSRIPYPPPQEGGDWSSYQRYAERFYGHQEARALYQAHIINIVSRTNTLTGLPYSRDPTIMTWELANEPVEPRTRQGVRHFLDWIATSASTIKSLDSMHLVISGSEGATTSEVQQLPGIDYATTHIWVQNAGWYDPTRHQATYEGAVQRAMEQLERQRQVAAALNQPLVLAEFGLARDRGSFDPEASSSIRLDYFSRLMRVVVDGVIQGNALAGLNFWAWAGEGRPEYPGAYWRPEQPYTGDPPHEPQGWYSVYDSDTALLAIIAEFAHQLQSWSALANAERL